MFIMTEQEALETVQDYANHNDLTFKDAITAMQNDDDLDSEDHGAVNVVLKAQKYYLVDLITCVGEFEFATIILVHTMPQMIWTTSNQIASTWYSCDYEKEDDAYTFDNGCTVHVGSYTEITETTANNIYPHFGIVF